MQWVERATTLLFDGETIETDLRVGSGGLVVTSHRLLAFTPDGDGSNYRAVDRPNVEGARTTTIGEARFLEQGVKSLIVGGVLVVAGQVVSLDSMVAGISLSTGGAGAVGIGRLMGTLRTMLALLAQLDDIMTLFGGLALALSAVTLGVYAWSREQVLEIRVAGDEPIHLPAPDDDTVIERLRRAIRPGDAPAGSGTETPADDPLA